MTTRHHDMARWALAAVLTALALSKLPVAVLNWTLAAAAGYWQEQWLWVIGLYAAAVIVRPGGFFPAFLFRAIFDPWRFRGPSFTRPWAVFGGATGFGVGMYISRCWPHVFPTFLYTLPFITACAVALAGLAAGAAQAVEKLSLTRDDRSRQGLLQGGVVLLVLGLIYWPLSRWEVFRTHPIKPFFYGFVLSLVHIWFIGLLQRYRVLAGRRKKIILVLVALGLITAMAVSQIRYCSQPRVSAPSGRVHK